MHPQSIGKVTKTNFDKNHSTMKKLNYWVVMLLAATTLAACGNKSEKEWQGRCH